MTSRLEAFSDAVIAIIITLMILEIKVPAGSLLSDWGPIVPHIVAYLFSFLVLAVYWNNHHHLIRASKTITGKIMWANMHLLFWLSLIPLATAWVGEHENFHQRWPVLIYALVGFCSGLAYFLLSRTIIKANPESAVLKRIEKDRKGIFTQLIYLLAIAVAFISPITTLFLIGATALIWLIPDRRLAVVE